MSTQLDGSEVGDRGRPIGLAPPEVVSRGNSPSRPPTSAEIDAVIAAAIANAPPAPPQVEPGLEPLHRSSTPLNTNLLPSAVGSDGRVNLFVGNLPYRVRWQDLKDLFRKAGTVLRADVSLGPDNRSRGFGTVLMGSREDAARAIDRFNGYTWQTRTLEVRPDRLPPEYEAQNHLSHQPHGRGGVFPFNAGAGSGGGGFPGVPPGWPSGQRPPMGFPPGQPGTHSMMGVLSITGQSHPGLLTSNGSSPILLSQSPAPSFGPGHPMTGTGTHNFAPIGASPLAGSLSSGVEVDPELQKDDASKFGYNLSPELVKPNIVRAPSPSVHNQEPLQNTGIREPRPVHLSQGVPSGSRSQLSPSNSSYGPSRTDSGDQFSGANPLSSQLAALPVQMEGLASRGAVLGPPSTLHDRVVFVSNLPLTMQWQELKDMLRPAGVIIRADVASDAEGRPRGFGTALFGSVGDAERAVYMFNDREIGGRCIRVHLERDSHVDIHRRQSASGPSLTFDKPEDRTLGGEANALRRNSIQPDETDLEEVLASESPVNAKIESPIGSRVPWHLNLAGHSTPIRGAAATNGGDSTPHFRNVPHPRHIALPTFQPIDNNPLSPLQSRNLPPMTPSMPGFHFNAYPETPQAHNAYFSHSLGPFSPGIPVTSPVGFNHNPFLNPAPGAPVDRTQGGSAQLGTPTTQAFPNNPIRGAGPPARPQPPPDSVGADVLTSNQPDYFATTLGESRTSVTPSPLNGKDRLASTGTNTDNGHTDLAGPTAAISLNDVERKPSQKSNGLNQEHPMSFNTNGNGLLGNADSAGSTGQSSPTSGVAARALGRVSMDDRRPSLGVDLLVASGFAAERRASSGDIGK